jgi:hypothetical protein
MNLSSRPKTINARRFRRITPKSVISFDASCPGLTRRNFVIRPNAGLNPRYASESGFKVRHRRVSSNGQTRERSFLTTRAR